MINSVWYQNLSKPLFSPAQWVFAPVWTVLYILIFIALAVYVFSKSENKLSGYVFFTIQIALNIAWVPVFFGLKNIFWGMIVILLLDIFVFLTIYRFFKISKAAGSILIPYLIWILFATYLNIAYFILN